MKKLFIILVSLLIMAGMVYYLYPESSLPANTSIDKLVVYKSKQTLEAYSNGVLLKRYAISIGQNAIGHKQFEGDKRTPEGVYFINSKNAHSSFHKNLGISYPNKKDLEAARKNKVKPGGEIKIHGLRNRLGMIGKFHRWINWTAGCIAVTNPEMDELYNNVPVGTPIIIYQ